jgi:nitrite reductase (NADH) small subunit
MLVAVVRLRDGRLRVIEDRCPHDGGTLSDGFLDGDVVVCARHGWEIDPCSGQCKTMPELLVLAVS